MKILVIMDTDGHFDAAYYDDRRAVLKLLKKIEDGGYYAEIIRDYGIRIKQDLSDYCCQEWGKIIDYFLQRGTLECIELPDMVPKACQCS